MSDCAEVHELAPEMALGLLDGAARADVLAHMGRCPSCRAEVRELADVVDGLAALGPSVPPPRGLQDRILDAIRAETPAPAPSRRPRRRRARYVVAAAIAAAIIAITGVVTVVATRPSHDSDVALNARTLAVAPLIGVSDHHVGDAYVSRGKDPWILVNVQYGLSGAGYRLVGVNDHGQVVDIGPMRAVGDQWAWAGAVPQAPDLVELRVVDASGEVACRASLT